MFRICSLASGSSGNSVYIGNESTHLLVDIGISKKRAKEALETIHVDPTSLSGIFITHEHADHISGLGVMTRGYKVPIYTTKKTWDVLQKKNSLGKIDESLVRFIKADEPFFIDEIEIMPFRSYHDAIDPMCFSFTYRESKIGFATDLGVYDDYITEHLSGSNILYLEANHDIKMLEAGPYPYYLKQRILSNLGHLSNDASSQLIEEVYHEELYHIILAHLSHENNHPDIAYITAERMIEKLFDISGHRTALSVAKREICSMPVAIEE